MVSDESVPYSSPLCLPILDNRTNRKRDVSPHTDMSMNPSPGVRQHPPCRDGDGRPRHNETG